MRQIYSLPTSNKLQCSVTVFTSSCIMRINSSINENNVVHGITDKPVVSCRTVRTQDHPQCSDEQHVSSGRQSKLLSQYEVHAVLDNQSSSSLSGQTRTVPDFASQSSVICRKNSQLSRQPSSTYSKHTGSS